MRPASPRAAPRPLAPLRPAEYEIFVREKASADASAVPIHSSSSFRVPQINVRTPTIRISRPIYK